MNIESVFKSIGCDDCYYFEVTEVVLCKNCSTFYNSFLDKELRPIKGFEFDYTRNLIYVFNSNSAPREWRRLSRSDIDKLKQPIAKEQRQKLIDLIKEIEEFME